jgi:hypothetical protein
MEILTGAEKMLWMDMMGLRDVAGAKESGCPMWTFFKL